jgi:uncharacterized protein YbjT (DUF2867 family)
MGLSRGRRIVCLTRVLVTGAGGFIGREVVAALSVAGCEVVAAIRPSGSDQGLGQVRIVELDLTRASPAAWAEALAGVDCVVNCAGVLAAGAGAGSLDVHDRGVAAMVDACEAAGVKRLIHFSAIGADDQLTPFARTKLAGDHAVMGAGLDWIILRPSVVLGAGSSGAGALIKALAVLPIAPAIESGPFDVVMIEDVRATVVKLVNEPTPAKRVLELVGPERLQLNDVVARYRSWMGWKPARRVKLPGWLMQLGFALGDLAGALGWRSAIRTMAQREMKRGATGDAALWRETTGIAPRSLGAALAAHPASLQDRRFAEFFWLKPVVMIVTILFWIGTGVISLTIGWDVGIAYLEEGGMGAWSAPSVVAGALADLAIGLGIAYRPTARWALWGAILISLFYAVAGTIVLPRLWEDPIGPMLKIWPLIVLNFVALALVRNR